MRADSYLYQNGYAESRTAAALLIRKGYVLIDRHTVQKPAEEIDETHLHSVQITEREKYVSRGGYKLEAALAAFALSPRGLSCLDIGASTGGFTDCLLSHGAALVTAIDSGHGQLHPRIATDSRVHSMEGVNARYLTVDVLSTPADCAVMDVSFISQTYILPAMPALLTPTGWLISLIKPQFELDRHAVGKKGIVKQDKDRAIAVNRVLQSGIRANLFPRGLIRSPIAGGDGNTEFLAYFTKQADSELPPEQTVRKLMQSLHLNYME